MITFYGATWCRDCKRSKSLLDSLGVVYDYINLEEKPEAAEIVEKINGGYQSIPTIIFPDGSHLIEPSDEVLTEKIKALGLMPSSTK